VLVWVLLQIQWFSSLFGTSQPAQGIGRSIALRLADDGFDVAVNDISGNSANLDTLVAEIKSKGKESSKHIADVSQDESVKEMVEEVVKQHGSLDIVRPPILFLRNLLI
jgi:NAD(P)-dependent dehydrogenase (short-subunit alcohol dehydrogenase family)